MSTTALAIDGHEIRRDGDMWCLTDLWRAGGTPEGKRPANWLRYDGAAFVEFLRDSESVRHAHSPEVVRSTKGNPRARTPPETWAHWQIALAYAKAISHSFHARVNEVYRAFTAGQLAPVLKPSVAEQELILLSLRIAALDVGRKSVWDLELKLELARLRKIVWTGFGREPKGLAFAYGKSWRIILGDAVYEELKRRNPHPRDGSLHAAWLQDRRYEITKDSDMAITLVLARRCTRWREFEAEMRSHFRRAPIQLRLVAGAAPKRLGA